MAECTKGDINDQVLSKFKNWHQCFEVLPLCPQKDSSMGAHAELRHAETVLKLKLSLPETSPQLTGLKKGS